MRFTYRVYSYFGLASIFGSMIYGFRYDPGAAWVNYLFDVAIYSAWAAVHLLMTRGWFKQAVYGSPSGSLRERQVYITVTVVTWLTVVAIQRPLPGGAIDIPEPLRFAATVGVVLGVFTFFEGATFAMLDGLLGVPGTAVSFSHGTETPLLTEGQYARIRHPMYRAALLVAVCTILMHPNTAQVLWCVMIGTTFLLFIPIEEEQLLAARGDAYREYMQRTPWRLLPGLW